MLVRSNALLTLTALLAPSANTWDLIQASTLVNNGLSCDFFVAEKCCSCISLKSLPWSIRSPSNLTLSNQTFPDAPNNIYFYFKLQDT